MTLMMKNVEVDAMIGLYFFGVTFACVPACQTDEAWLA